MPQPAPRATRSLAAGLCAISLAATALAGCQALGGGGGGVMPASSEIGLPPSMRGALPGRDGRTAAVDEEGRPMQTAPTRRLDLPKNARADTRSADDGPRRIRRDEIEAAAEAGGGSSGGIRPAMSANGGVGVGGKF